MIDAIWALILQANMSREAGAQSGKNLRFMLASYAKWRGY